MKTDREILAGRTAFQLYFEPLGTMLNGLSDAEAGELFKAIYKYALHGKETNFADRTLSMVFLSLKSSLDYNNKEYIKRSRKNAENANKRWGNNANACDGMRTHANDADTDTDTDTDIETEKDTYTENENKWFPP